MGRLIISTAMTVDGVIDGFEWFVSEGGHDVVSRRQFVEAEAMLLGRKTYEGLAGYWPSQEGPWADLLNPMPKYVVSRTLSEPLEWNARLLEGELEEALPRLKDELDGDLVMSGCGELAREPARGGARRRAALRGAPGRLGRRRAAVRRRAGPAQAPRNRGVRLRSHGQSVRAGSA